LWPLQDSSNAVAAPLMPQPITTTSNIGPPSSEDLSTSKICGLGGVIGDKANNELLCDATVVLHIYGVRLI
jgi:hypothetical protein